MTLRKRLTLWYASLLTLIIIILGAVIFAVMRWIMITGIDNTLDETSVLIQDNSLLVFLNTFDSESRFDVELPELDFFQASGVEVQVWLVSADGDGYVPDASSANLRNYHEPLDASSLGSTHEAVYNTVDFEGVGWRVRTSPIWFTGSAIGNIQVAASLQNVTQATRELFKLMLVSCGLAILGSAILSRWLAERMIRPIEDITSTAANIAGTKDLSTRLEWDGPMDELGRLTAVFNQMMGRLEHLFSVQQRFVADISHELRTPLTSIQGNMDMARRYGMDDETISAIRAESGRMSRLVNDLLLLARADYGGLEIDLYPLDLDTILMDTLSQVEANNTLEGREVTLKLQHIEPLRIQGNTDRLKQLILNLLDNGVKFTPDGGSVNLSLLKQDDNALIRVEDTGIGIEPEDITRVFDRFYQSDPARTHDGDGFGLGLSIAKWIVEAHGGTIQAESEPGKGTTMTISIPLLGSEDKPKTKKTGNGAVSRSRLPAIRRRSPEETH